MTRQEFTKIFLSEMVLFPQIEVTPIFTEAWFSHFKKIDGTLFKAALRLSIQESASPFLPAPGQVWAQVKRLQTTDDDLETADTAWVV